MAAVMLIGICFLASGILILVRTPDWKEKGVKLWGRPVKGPFMYVLAGLEIAGGILLLIAGIARFPG